jgi:hypothetical protein
MGNSLRGGKKNTTKVMKINGETFKLKTPIKALDVIKDYPNYVLLESESVKHFGIRAKPLQAQDNLEPKRLYFLVVLPNPMDNIPRRVRSGIEISAKDRLESLMLARRSASDLTLMKLPAALNSDDAADTFSGGAMKTKGQDPSTRVKLRLPRAEVERLMKESENDGDIAEKIMELYVKNNQGVNDNEKYRAKQKQILPSNNDAGCSRGRFDGEGFKQARRKRVSFLPINEGGSQIAAY